MTPPRDVIQCSTCGRVTRYYRIAQGHLGLVAMCLRCERIGMHRASNDPHLLARAVIHIGGELVDLLRRMRKEARGRH